WRSGGFLSTSLSIYHRSLLEAQMFNLPRPPPLRQTAVSGCCSSVLSVSKFLLLMSGRCFCICRPTLQNAVCRPKRSLNLATTFPKCIEKLNCLCLNLYSQKPHKVRLVKQTFPFRLARCQSLQLQLSPTFQIR